MPLRNGGQKRNTKPLSHRKVSASKCLRLTEVEDIREKYKNKPGEQRLQPSTGRRPKRPSPTQTQKRVLVETEKTRLWRRNEISALVELGGR